MTMDALLREVLAELSVPAPMPADDIAIAAATGDKLDIAEVAAVIASQIGSQVAEALAQAAQAKGGTTPDLSALSDLPEILKKIDSRMTGIGLQAFGASGPANIADNQTRELGRVTVKANDTDFASETTLADRLPKNAKQFADGQYRTAGGKVSLSLATPNGSFHLDNPVGSGRSITITEFALGTSASVDVAYWKDATSTGTAQDVFIPHRAYEGAVTTVGVVKAGVGVLSGGTQLSPITRLPTQGERIPYTVVLMPGDSVAVQATATTTLDFYASVTWIETDL